MNKEEKANMLINLNRILLDNRDLRALNTCFGQKSKKYHMLTFPTTTTEDCLLQLFHHLRA